MTTDETLVKRLIREGFTNQVSKPGLHPDMLEFFKTLAGNYVYLNIDGSDGGRFLYKILFQDGLAEIAEQDIGALETQDYQDNHFILALPDWAIYDFLLGEMTLEEALDYAAWGGSFSSHPTWTFLKMSSLMEQFEALLDRQVILRMMRGT